MGKIRDVMKNYGERQISPLREAIRDREGIRSMLDNAWTAEPCIVNQYYPETQRVDVLLKNVPEQEALLNLPILGTSGDLRIIRFFRSVVTHRIEGADVGFALFPRTASHASFDKRGRARPDIPLKHHGLGAVFLPGPHVIEDGLPPRLDPPTDDLNNVNERDTALMHSSGSMILFKHTGDVVIKSKAGAKVYIGPDDSDASSFSDAGVGSLGSTGNVRLG